MKSETDPIQNVDHDEIEKFSSVASRWWDTQSEFKTLHDINPLRITYIEQHCAGLNGKRILDIGCGGGILAESMAAKGAIVTGIDMAEPSIEVARLHLMESGHNIDYEITTIEDFADKHENEFDVITCLEMLEHVPNPASIIQAASKALKPEGQLILSTLNRNAKSFLLAIVGAEYIMKMLPKGTHEFDRFIKPAELARAARQALLDVNDITGMSYNPLTKDYFLGRDVDVNYLMTCQPR